MKNAITAGAALLLTSSLAQAGGLDRSGNPYSVLFEDGNYVQLSFSAAKPDVSGSYDESVPSLGTGSTGNMAESYASAGIALKYAVNDKLDLALFYNSPFGADALYGAGFYDGLQATWDTTQITALAKYQAAPGISVYGGLRGIQSQAKITLPDSLVRLRLQGAALAGSTAAGTILANNPTSGLEYNAETESNMQVGYVIGAAYERPEIALRVALTYESGVTHDFDTSETLVGIGVNDAQSTTDIQLPQSIALDFQSGVAADTLVFGTIKWTEWSVWEVRPAEYLALTGQEVTGIDNDVMTYRIGVGRRINDAFSAFGRVTYEKSDGGVSSRLSPTDGSVSYGVGGSYTVDNMKITAGVEYALLGDAKDSTNVVFSDNSALGFGMNVGFSF
ncbi:OmpP1/FadL family transporter [Yoonia sp.]|uniref:OmpP1/FadL family transporter n=1 Tax=Yoonia sp. TaxID=2212373 RepID=UPI0035C7FEDC